MAGAVVVGAGVPVSAVVGGAAVTGGCVVTGAAVTGVVVVGAGVGTSLKITPGLGTVVAGSGARVVEVEVEVAGRSGAGGTVRATATVVEVVELGTEGPAGVDGGPVVPAAKRLPTSVVEVLVTMLLKVRLGRVALARGPGRDASRDVAAVTRATSTAPVPRTSRMLTLVVLCLAYHQSRSRSCACGRPNAAFLPMNEGKR